MRNNYSTLSNTYNIKTVNQTYTDTLSSCTDRPSCSNYGDCVNGTCICDTKFRLGNNCEIPKCTLPPGCSNHGQCGVDGKCTCDTVPYVWFGDNCEKTDRSVPPCDENEGWFWNPSYENECVYRCTKDGQIASNPENNNTAYKYVEPPLGSQGAGKCYKIFDALDYDSRNAACYTEGFTCQYNSNAPAMGEWKAQGWDHYECTGWPFCTMNLDPSKNGGNVVAAEGNPIDYFNPIYYYNSDDPGMPIEIGWGEPNEKGIGEQPDSYGIFKQHLDISYPYPSIPTS